MTFTTREVVEKLLELLDGEGGLADSLEELKEAYGQEPTRPDAARVRILKGGDRDRREGLRGAVSGGAGLLRADPDLSERETAPVFRRDAGGGGGESFAGPAGGNYRASPVLFRRSEGCSGTTQRLHWPGTLPQR